MANHAAQPPLRRNPQNDIAVALPRPAKRPQPIDNPTLEPNEALAPLVGRILVIRRTGSVRAIAANAASLIAKP